jgi:hypothetical protein
MWYPGFFQQRLGELFSHEYFSSIVKWTHLHDEKIQSMIEVEPKDVKSFVDLFRERTTAVRY